MSASCLASSPFGGGASVAEEALCCPLGSSPESPTGTRTGAELRGPPFIWTGVSGAAVTRVCGEGELFVGGAGGLVVGAVVELGGVELPAPEVPDSSRSVITLDRGPG